VIPERQRPPPSVALNQAVGVTAEEFNCTVRDAFDALVDHADATGQSVELLAVRVVNHQARCRL